MKNILIFLSLLCFGCEIQEPMKPNPIKYKTVQGVNRLATGSSFNPVYIPIIKIKSN